YQFEELTLNPGSMALGAYEVSPSTVNSGLAPNTTYAYRVRVQDVAGNIAISNVVSAVTLSAVPSLASLGVFTSSIAINLGNPASNPPDTVYALQVSSTVDFSASIATLR